MTPDADTLLALIERSRREETPGRRLGGGITVTARVVPIVPCTPATGTSRDEIVRRLRRWGVDWDRARLDPAVAQLVAAGRMVYGPKGLYSRREVA